MKRIIKEGSKIREEIKWNIGKYDTELSKEKSNRRKI